VTAWSIESINWSRFDKSLVDPVLVRLVKAAALVEYNGATYTDYLCNVFAGDADFQAKAKEWGQEEVQHGQALAEWAKLADPDFDFQHAFERFTSGYSVPVDVEASVRGSRSGELIARCMVETGTSSFYTAMSKASKEPVLAEIAHLIAADEFRHYKLFYDTLKSYLQKEQIGRLGRAKAAVSRIRELADDELAYAYYASNVPESVPYDRTACSNAYLGRIYPHYDPDIIRRSNAMILKAVGLTPHGRLNSVLTAGAYRFVSYRAHQLAEAA
jgi:rubrerythrin|tara:strand:- start:413 stop:1228 length:816 start_codon:yes stop_codon:yes gene_type:complete